LNGELIKSRRKGSERKGMREASLCHFVLDSDLLVKRMVPWISGVQSVLAEL